MKRNQEIEKLWICPNVPHSRANTIDRFYVDHQRLVGESAFTEPYDLMEAIIVNISKDRNVDNCDNELITVLTDFFDDTKTSEERLRSLESHGIHVTEEVEREVMTMTSFYQTTLERGEKIGEERGMKIGEERGEIKTLVSLVRDGLLDVSVAAKRCSKTDAEFKELLKKYNK